jgi:hypothetical protein
MLGNIQKIFKRWKNQEKSYQSPIQIILDQWDKNHAPSTSQKKEFLKHVEIRVLRDNHAAPARQKKNWLDQDDIQ